MLCIQKVTKCNYAEIIGRDRNMSGLTLIEQLIIILIFFLIVNVGAVYGIRRIIKRSKQRRVLNNLSSSEMESVAFDKEIKYDESDSEENQEELKQLLKEVDALTEQEQKEEIPTVISVENVSMEFKIATTQVSGIKELIILKIKGKETFCKFKALDHINFKIKKGEVVGIIGTNGSGKSTILKIISKALIPTEGQVNVDRRKVQLLTLGTGFDMELTARENIYLNGAIIGYSRDYIEKHFDEIIEFAELQSFVDEKLKNYSSGMVSRLGFAIATSGDAAEILILDEVLSVGDIYFREKSMRRIQEMIHGGSTVIMVSHSTDTIRKNCTRAIWIEKGKLLADGNPREVCKQYEEMQEKRKECIGEEK